MKNTFASLPAGKRERVINGALAAFAKNGYKKTSAMDLAASAGISKAMIFSYFGTKRGAYEYVCEYAVNTVWEEFRRNAHKILTDDFFERIQLSLEIKLSFMNRSANLLAFLTSMYYERDDTVRPYIERLLGESFSLREDVLLRGVDNSRFKGGVDPQSVAELLMYMSSGLADEWHRGETDLDELLQKFNRAAAMLKNNLYKEEFLA
ncbi:MAG: TetR/AcrR family transcriptional regulator [Oscillospiraceae bacterium]|nr:TetR/AcrR family transcriptional regulator [Oscillospiraceae bacterium]